MRLTCQPTRAAAVLDCTVARAAGREQKSPGDAPPAYASAVFGYTTPRDATEDPARDQVTDRVQQLAVAVALGPSARAPEARGRNRQ
jgi:hypothetical protein